MSINDPRPLFWYELTYADERGRVLVEATDLHTSGGDWSLLSGGKPEPKTWIFYKHPVGVVHIVLATDVREIRMLAPDEAPR